MSNVGNQEMLCSIFNVHRSTYKYWRSRKKKVNPKKVQQIAVAKEIHKASQGSAGSRTIATLSHDLGRLCAVKRHVS